MEISAGPLMDGPASPSPGEGRRSRQRSPKTLAAIRIPVFKRLDGRSSNRRSCGFLSAWVFQYKDKKPFPRRLRGDVKGVCSRDGRPLLGQRGHRFNKNSPTVTGSPKGTGNRWRNFFLTTFLAFSRSVFRRRMAPSPFF